MLIVKSIQDERIYQGRLFESNGYELAVANNDFFYYRFIIGASIKSLYTTFVIEGNVETYAYTGTTYTDNGTEQNVRALNRNSTNTTDFQLYTDPTIDVLGILRSTRLRTAGSGPASSGAETSLVQRIYIPNSDILVAVKNIAGTAKDIGIYMYIHEEG